MEALPASPTSGSSERPSTTSTVSGSWESQALKLSRSSKSVSNSRVSADGLSSLAASESRGKKALEFIENGTKAFGRGASLALGGALTLVGGSAAALMTGTSLAIRVVAQATGIGIGGVLGFILNAHKIAQTGKLKSTLEGAKAGAEVGGKILAGATCVASFVAFAMPGMLAIVITYAGNKLAQNQTIDNATSKLFKKYFMVQLPLSRNQTTLDPIGALLKNLQSPEKYTPL